MGVTFDLDAPFEPDQSFKTSYGDLVSLQRILSKFVEFGKPPSRFPVLMSCGKSPELTLSPPEVQSLRAETSLALLECETLWVPAVHSTSEIDESINMIKLGEDLAPEPIFYAEGWNLGVNLKAVLTVNLQDGRTILSRQLLPEPPHYRTAEGEALRIKPLDGLDGSQRWLKFESTSTLALEHLAWCINGIAGVCEHAVAEGVAIKVGF